MAPSQPLTVISIISSLIVSINASNVYKCEPGKECIIDHNTKGRYNIFDATLATGFELICSPDTEYYPCYDFQTFCPIDLPSNGSCTLQCDDNNACRDITIHTQNVTNINLLCGTDATLPATDIVCSNITINGLYDITKYTVPPKQRINILCNDQGDAPLDTPTCADIKTKNLSIMANGFAANSNVSVDISCTVSWVAEEEVNVCSRFDIEGGKAKNFHMLLEGDLIESNIMLNETLENLFIELEFVGTVVKSKITAPFVHKFKINATSTIGFQDSTVIGPYLQQHAPVDIETYDEAGFENSTFEGRFLITGNGKYVGSTFNAKTAGFVSINLGAGGLWDRNTLVIEDSNASLSFFGATSGRIDAINSAYLSVICKSYDPEASCDGLIMDLPSYKIVNDEKKALAFLECIDYGCTNITTNSPNGAEDIGVVAILCDCEYGANGESGDSCIGVINIGCGDDGTAVFDGETCDGNSECCGNILSETENALCTNPSSSSAMNDWEVVGVTIGVIAFLLLFTSLLCYCQNQRTLRHQFKRAQATNPYTQSLQQEEEKKEQNGGYGAVTDEDAL